MKKFKVFLFAIIAAISAVAVCAAFGGCSGDDDRKYFVEIRVCNTLGDRFVFSRGVDELTCAYSYTGEEIRFYIDAYRLPDHPRYGDRWFEPDGEGANVFSSVWLYEDNDGNYITDLRSVKERGQYSINYHAESSSDIWFPRSVYLTVIIV